MSGGKFNISDRKTRVLVAPLEWGLGHATRCIPIIRELLAQDCEVLIGAEAAAQALLEKEFPQLQILPLQGYRMRYSRKGWWFPVKIFFQFPKILFSIYNEHRWLKNVIREHSIDAVISDNRFGLYSTTVPCIYLTHQLLVKTGNGFTERMAQKIHYHFINKYRECWVPDMAGTINLAGALSHPKHLPATPISYIGPLSRFEKKEVERKYDLGVIISGPEPQRTIFEEILLEQLTDYAGKILFVRGLPGNSDSNPQSNSNIEMHDHLPAKELNEAILQSEMIISRSGYTTVMDLAKLQKPAIFIPTPGQPEQEYLAEYLMNEKVFYCTDQKDLNIRLVLQEAESFSYKTISFATEDYKNSVKKFIGCITPHQ